MEGFFVAAAAAALEVVLFVADHCSGGDEGRVLVERVSVSVVCSCIIFVWCSSFMNIEAGEDDDAGPQPQLEIE
jgi:hypothetical protein